MLRPTPKFVLPPFNIPKIPGMKPVQAVPWHGSPGPIYITVYMNDRFMNVMYEFACMPRECLLGPFSDRGVWSLKVWRPLAERQGGQWGDLHRPSRR